MEQVAHMKLQQLETVSVNASLEAQPSKYIVSPGLLTVLRAEGAQGEMFTKKEIMNYLRTYIVNRLLFDQENPTVIHCDNDPLGEALGVKQFTINEAMALLSAKVRLATPPQKGHVLALGYPGNAGEKRKSSDLEDEPSLKRHCSDVDTKPTSTTRSPPFFFRVYEAPDYDSSPETALSCQGYETAIAIDSKESSDDLWYLDTEEEYEVEIETDGFEVEYEVNSLANSSGLDDDTDSESDVALQEMVGAAILVCQNDSDVEFWADSDSDSAIADEQSTSESDPEITDGDKWKCLGCMAFNRPLLRFCQKCWRLRSDWLPDHKRRPQREHARRRRRRQTDFRRTLSLPVGGRSADRHFNGQDRQFYRNPRLPRTNRSLIDVSVIDEIGSPMFQQDDSPASTNLTRTNSLGVDLAEGSTPVSSGMGTCTSTDGVTPLPSSETSADAAAAATTTTVSADAAATAAAHATASSMCSICLSRPKNASIVHGKIGHQMCCYSCGKKLWAHNKPCPICRRTIQKVIHNYIV